MCVCLAVLIVTKLFELIQLAPDRNLVAAAPDSQQNLMKLGRTGLAYSCPWVHFA